MVGLDVLPHHKPIRDLFQQVETGEAFGQGVCVHTPPQHGKTSVALAGMLWLCLLLPGINLGYLTYSHDNANKFQGDLRDMAERLGLDVCQKPYTYSGAANQVSTKQRDWIFALQPGAKERSRILWTYPGSTSTGRTIDMWVLDDVYTGAPEARRVSKRRDIEGFVKSAVFTRARSTGQQIVYHFNTRFHPKDLTHYLCRDFGFKALVCPAINDKGEALWPEKHPAAALEAWRIKLGAEFETTYQGAPRSDSQILFKEPKRDAEGQWDFGFYAPKELPPIAELTIMLGLDLAYSKDSASDYSVVAVLGKHQATGITYLIELNRQQMDPINYAHFIKHHYQARYHKPFELEGGGADYAAVPLLQAAPYNVRINFRTTNESKYVRAQKVSAAWNAGKFLLPDPHKHADWEGPCGRHQHWVPILVDELVAFTGWNDEHDDQVDAIATAFNQLNRASSGWRSCPEYLMIV